MIDLYTWATPNGRKISIFLEEVALPYEVIKIDISNGEQFAAEFLAINPNGKIPAIVDHDGPGGGRLAVFESGAILIYLAEKTGKLLPSEPVARVTAIEWLMFQMGGFGPMLGQASFPTLRAGTHPLRNRALREGGRSPLRRPRSPARRRGVPRRRLFDRRYRVLPVGGALRVAGHHARRFPQRPALVHGDLEPPGRATWHAGAEALSRRFGHGSPRCLPM